MISFFLAQADQDYEAAKLLFEEYADSIGINLDFQHFKEELADLREMYAPPYGGIILAKESGKIIGCVGVRKIIGNAGELKRMYIQPAYQGRGAGKCLLEHALQLAKQSNYSIIKLDTLSSMPAAMRLYKQAGFYEIPPYYQNPVGTAVYFEKIL